MSARVCCSNASADLHSLINAVHRCDKIITKMETVIMDFVNMEIPQITFDPRLESANIFSDVFGTLGHQEWNEVLVKSIDINKIETVEFPTFPPTELQNRIHGHDSITSLNEASEFYKLACDHNIAGPTSAAFQSGYMLDYGCGWGRILRQFMRDFPLKNIVGYEPSGIFGTVARANNPYVAFLGGGYMPDGILPESRFDLIVGWSVYSHLSETYAKAWLAETARVLSPGGSAMYTTWGLRFLERLQAEEAQMNAGIDIHWYSKICLLGTGDINQRIEDYHSGKFVWCNSGNNDFYGEAFISQKALQNIIDDDNLPLVIDVFDTITLGQDAFILRRI